MNTKINQILDNIWKKSKTNPEIGVFMEDGRGNEIMLSKNGNFVAGNFKVHKSSAQDIIEGC
jgi:hypothetical protein